VSTWNGDAASLRQLQSDLAGEVVPRDGFAKPLRSIAGFAVAFGDAGATIRAAAVLFDAETLDILDQQVASVPTAMPNIPDLRSFRQLPALLAALGMLETQPDLAFVDGHGIAHPRRFGIAAHFGVASGLPSIGVTGEALVGEGRIVLHDMRGAFTPLRDGREQIGWLLRSKPGCPPLIVSPGHRVAMASAPELVMRYVAADRLPEPTRLAARIASGD
jgi:deoxyribonuclease V